MKSGLRSVWKYMAAIWPVGEMRGSWWLERRGPPLRSIPPSSDLRVYPAHHGDWRNSFSLVQPAVTDPDDVTGCKDVYVFQDFARRDWRWGAGSGGDEASGGGVLAAPPVVFGCASVIGKHCLSKDKTKSNNIWTVLPWCNHNHKVNHNLW